MYIYLILLRQNDLIINKNVEGPVKSPWKGFNAQLMVHERRNDMLRYRIRWRDQPFAIIASLIVLIVIVDCTYIWLGRSPASRFFDLCSSLLSEHSASSSIKWNRVLAIISVIPIISYVASFLCLQFLFMLPWIIILYGRVLDVLLALSFLAITLYMWTDGFSICACLAHVAFTFLFFLGRNPTIWYHVIQQTKGHAPLLRIRLLPSLLTATINSLVIYGLAFCSIWSMATLNNRSVLIYNSTFFLLFGWIWFHFCQFVLRGGLTAHFIKEYFLADPRWSGKRQVRQAIIQLLTGSLGTLFVSAVYYGGRNAIIMYGLILRGFDVPALNLEDADGVTRIDSIGILFSCFVLLHLASSQRYRSLFQVVAYAYSFAESLMLTEVYPSFKTDLLNKFTCTLSFLIALGVAVVSNLLLTNWSHFPIPDAIKLCFMIMTISYMTCQLVFEPIRASAFTLAVGLVEDPKYLTAHLPWLKNYYPPFQ